MRIKEFEYIVQNYGHGPNVHLEVGTDDTDHLVFICDRCKKVSEVIEVYNKKYKDNKLNCNLTYVWAACHNCKLLLKRKFYWKGDDGRFCIKRTGY